MTTAWLLLDQVPGGGEVTGGALLVIGVLVAMRGGRRPVTARAPEPMIAGSGAQSSTQ